MPPSAEGFAARLVLGPALRTQPDRRLVELVRDGYEVAFEEIVRRYGKPLGRYAAAIVGSRADDVTQDAFSKALLALRRDSAEIELRPWLFRIVRNTALNELRDNPPPAEAVAEAIAGGRNPAEELERREELTDLMERLKSLPEPQRAAIVMRELEGLSHEEIATALGLSGGAARQAIYRARRALRNGFGMLLPLPLLKALLAGAAASPAVEAAASAAGVGGAGVALKTATATVLVAGAVGAGVAVQNDRQERASTEAPPERTVGGSEASASSSTASAGGSGEDSSGDGRRHGAEDSSGKDGEGSNRGPGGDDGSREERDDDHGGRSGSSGPGSDDGDEDNHDRSGHSGRDSSSGPGSGELEEDERSEDHSSGGSGSSGSDNSSGSGSGDVDNSGSGSGGSGENELDDLDPEDSSGPGGDGLSVEADDAD